MSKRVKKSIDEILSELDECKTEKQYLKVKDKIQKHVTMLHELICDTTKEWQLDIIRYEKKIEKAKRGLNV